MKLFITGSTGYLGKELIPLLAKSQDHLYLLVRKNSLQKARALYSQYDNITLVKGDLTEPDLIEGSVLEFLENVESILHMGAFYDLKGDHPTCYMQNVLGTLNVLFFAKLCKKLKTFHYVSTIAVSGDHGGEFNEDDFYASQNFSNPYSSTKYEAERIVRNVKGDFKIKIYRPGIIIGHSETGEFEKIDGPYYFWERMAKFKSVAPAITHLPFLPLPLNSKATLPVVSVDHVAKMIALGVAGEESEEKIKCYQLVDREAPKVEELIYRSLAAFNIQTKIVSMDNHPLIEKSFDLLGIPSEIIHYMTTPVNYGNKNAKKDLGLKELSSFDTYHEAIFKKAKKLLREGK
ncbi:hypothetical protein A9Q84_15605 [Halobacteriovorax marinus]|uniref:Thioester reductase (TE) domain-containing protein n=1 Tax=Halobacteriovorax marinus TaxID=97084 RepID=A0A1Y5F3W9_9BACT|nr:hypothetical protein A9Q84_15605 [Halobacteriovorax marinus]